MTIQLLQLNINADNFLPALTDYLKTHEFDILQFQEVAGEQTICGNIRSTHNMLTELQHILGHSYKYTFALTNRFTSSPKAFLGDAIFYASSFRLIDENTIWLKKNTMPFPSGSGSFENLSAAIQHAQLEKEGKKISFLTAHLIKGKTSVEEPHSREQNKRLVAYVSTLFKPFVLTGDFNINPNQPTILDLEQYAKNLVKEYAVTNTLNPRRHRAKELFPKGIAVDYVFVSDDIVVKEFEVLSELDLSDHLGLTATIEV